MGFLTRSAIITEGMATAGRDDLGTLAVSWLQNWLNAVAVSWDWAILRREANVSLSAQTLDVGNTSGGISDRITKILDEMWWYRPDKTANGRITIRDQNAKPTDILQQPTSLGAPHSVRIMKLDNGIQRLSFEPIPDQTYTIYIPYQTPGPQILSDFSIPWYENDETLIQVVAFKTHEYSDGKDHPATQLAQQNLTALLNADKFKYGTAKGQNDTVFKDPTTFPRSRR